MSSFAVNMPTVRHGVLDDGTTFCMTRDLPISTAEASGGAA